MKKYSLYLLLLTYTLSSCSDFLEESSQDLMIPKSVKDYKELIFGEVFANKEVLHPYLDYMTDDVKDHCYYGTTPTPLYPDSRESVWAYYTWQPNPEIGFIGEYTEDIAWTSYYHKILMTNIILEDLPKMNGSHAEQQDLTGEACFMRAHSYFMLANLYGTPYEPATAENDPCVPINDEISISDKMMKRATNANVYARIEADINRAIQSFKQGEGEKSIFRPNLTASYLLASRIALFQKKYDKTILYADSVLRNTSHTLQKFAAGKPERRFLSSANREIVFSFGTTTHEFFMKDNFAYKGLLVVSDELLNLYTADDYRLNTYFTLITGSQKKPAALTYTFYIPTKWFRTSPTAYSKAFRLSEAYLNRAEAYAEQGNTNKALADLTELRTYRMKDGTATVVVDGDGLIAAVRKERRREFAFEEFRWFDLRRYGCPPLQHIYSSSEQNVAGDLYKLQDKKSYILPVPRSERERNTAIELFDRPESEPIK